MSETLTINFTFKYKNMLFHIFKENNDFNYQVKNINNQQIKDLKLSENEIIQILKSFNDDFNSFRIFVEK